MWTWKHGAVTHSVHNPTPLARNQQTTLRGLMVPHMSAPMVHVHRLNIVSTSVTLHVSRVSALPTLWLMLCFCPFVARQLPENGSRVTPRHVLCVTRKREFVISLDLGTSTSTTRTAGDRLTLLYLHLTTLYYVHCCTIISLTTRTNIVGRRAPGPIIVFHSARNSNEEPMQLQYNGLPTPANTR